MSINQRNTVITSHKYISAHMAPFLCQKCWLGILEEYYLVRKYQWTR